MLYWRLRKSPASSNPTRSANESVRTDTGSGVISWAQRKPGCGGGCDGQQEAYSEATIAGKKVHFPERKLRTVRYDLEATYGGIYDEIVSGIESLALAPYNLESYKKKGVEVDEFEAGREQALVGIFKSRYLKRFESSVEAFRISVRRALAFLKTFESYILDGRVLRSPDFHRAYLVCTISRAGETRTARNAAAGAPGRHARAHAARDR
jgi:hypothetical protein